MDLPETPTGSLRLRNLFLDPFRKIDKAKAALRGKRPTAGPLNGACAEIRAICTMSKRKALLTLAQLTLH